jgi:hypothetical protein
MIKKLLLTRYCVRRAVAFIRRCAVIDVVRSTARIHALTRDSEDWVLQSERRIGRFGVMQL